ncbi:CitMHS family transporter [Novosphingobium malaysiense]|uniref:Citrate transporter-like domain-containing protein n=1 Tax=Novosphingobium malaysiense TaxID=1348853 RepID=A0A0B1ZFI8_9SPHN|nr:citrate:proton symporter [Novosphingobium malaysiense]KHK89846.1 hypothetical protein LK12_18200 [Novosphingobium malaysiense]
MLALAGLLTIAIVLAAILSKKVTPLVALGAIPPVMALLLGFGSETGAMMGQGMVKVAPMAAMFLFAILFFGILSDAGLFRPVIAAIVRMAKDHPARLSIGTAVLTSIVHLDGSGAATFLIVIPALAPVYDRLGIDRLTLTVVVAMAAGVGNMLPWGGPTIRAATALDVPVMTLFKPMLPVYLTGVVTMLAVSWWLGHRALRSGAGIDGRSPDAGGSAFAAPVTADAESDAPMSRTRQAIGWFLVVSVLAAMLSEVLPPAAAFMLGTIAALLLCAGSEARQNAALRDHAASGISMVAILFAAGCFTGILNGTGMIEAMAHGGANLLPSGSAAHLPVLIGVLAMPLSLLFDPDSFYFGILPVLAGIAGASGGDPLAVGQAAIVGQMTTGFPISPLTPATFLLVGLAGVNLADHQRAAFGWLFLLSLVMTAAAYMLGILAP